MATTLVELSLPLALALVVPACDRDRTDHIGPSSQRSTSVTAARVVTNASAVTQITEARCTREFACDHVGPNRRYANREVCAELVSLDSTDDFTTSDCPRGIDPNRLEHCLTAIKNESCNNPLETLERLAACRTGAVCLAGPTPVP
jgi:hypothetical protein